MESVKTFILDNIRYIVSAILLIFIVLILVKCTGEPKEKEETAEENNVVMAEDEQQEMQEVQEPANDLIQDGFPEVNALTEQYYTARANGDIDTLRSIMNELSDAEADYIVKMSEHIESYNNLVCYTKMGLDENSYVTYVCNDIKFANVDTMAPSLNTLYIRTNEQGSLYIDNSELDTYTESQIAALNEGEDVQNLALQVQNAYLAALEQEEKLRNLVSVIQSSSQQEEQQTEQPQTEQPQQEETQPETSEEAQPSENTQSKETVYAKETVNVRNQPDENAQRVGQIARGDSVTRISQDDNGWSQIEYNGTTAYVKTEFLTTDAADNSPSSGKGRIVETAKVRSGEDTSSELIETLFPGTEVEVLEKLASGRTKISYNGKTGYVNSECVGR